MYSTCITITGGTMKIDFMADVHAICSDLLAANGIKLKHQDDPLLDLYIYSRRAVNPMPRAIYKANDFSCPKEYRERLAYVENAIKRGDNLLHFMTRSIFDCSRDDAMLYHWNIVHLHISNEMDKVKNDGFMRRSGLLLYVYFTDNASYFIRTIPHSGVANMWSLQDCLECINQNWPELIAGFELKGAVAGAVLPDSGIAALRKKNGNALVTLSNGKVIVPPGLGVVSDGSPVECVIDRDRYAEKIKAAEDYVKDNLADIFRDKGITENIDDVECHVSQCFDDRIEVFVNSNIKLNIRLYE